MAKKEEKKKGIGDVAMDAILEGKSNEDALAAVKAAFPDSKTTAVSINWYRGKLRNDGAKLKRSGKPVPTAREMKAAAKEAQVKQEKKDAKAAKDPLA